MDKSNFDAGMRGIENALFKAEFAGVAFDKVLGGIASTSRKVQSALQSFASTSVREVNNVFNSARELKNAIDATGQSIEALGEKRLGEIMDQTLGAFSEEGKQQILGHVTALSAAATGIDSLKTVSTDFFTGMATSISKDLLPALEALENQRGKAGIIEKGEQVGTGVSNVALFGQAMTRAGIDPFGAKRFSDFGKGLVGEGSLFESVAQMQGAHNAESNARAKFNDLTGGLSGRDFRLGLGDGGPGGRGSTVPPFMDAFADQVMERFWRRSEQEWNKRKNDYLQHGTPLIPEN